VNRVDIDRPRLACTISRPRTRPPAGVQRVTLRWRRAGDHRPSRWRWPVGRPPRTGAGFAHLRSSPRSRARRLAPFRPPASANMTRNAHRLRPVIPARAPLRGGMARILDTPPPRPALIATLVESEPNRRAAMLSHLSAGLACYPAAGPRDRGGWGLRSGTGLVPVLLRTLPSRRRPGKACGQTSSDRAGLRGCALGFRAWGLVRNVTGVRVIRERDVRIVPLQTRDHGFFWGPYRGPNFISLHDLPVLGAWHGQSCSRLHLPKHATDRASRPETSQSGRFGRSQPARPPPHGQPPGPPS